MYPLDGRPRNGAGGFLSRPPSRLSFNTSTSPSADSLSCSLLLREVVVEKVILPVDRRVSDSEQSTQNRGSGRCNCWTCCRPPCIVHDVPSLRHKGCFSSRMTPLKDHENEQACDSPVEDGAGTGLGLRLLAMTVDSAPGGKREAVEVLCSMQPAVSWRIAGEMDFASCLTSYFWVFIRHCLLFCAHWAL